MLMTLIIVGILCSYVPVFAMGFYLGWKEYECVFRQQINHDPERTEAWRENQRNAKTRWQVRTGRR